MRKISIMIRIMKITLKNRPILYIDDLDPPLAVTVYISIIMFSFSFFNLVFSIANELLTVYSIYYIAESYV